MKFLLPLLLTACLQVAEERVHQEDAVGQSDTVKVQDGLASIRLLSPSGVTLWANAPRLTVDVTTTGPFTVDVLNLPSDAEAPPFTAAPGDTPTNRRWTLPAAGTYHLTIESPDAATAGPFRFVALADVQEAIGEVQDVYRLIAAQQARFVLFQGDLTQTGSLPQLERFQNELKQLPIPLYATLGNHELGSRPPVFHRLVGRGNFRFVFRGVQFTMLDDASATLAPAMYDRLATWLDEGKDRLHVVGMHIPPIDPVGERNGAFASRAEADRLLALLAAAQVDLTLYGHIHSYYSFFNAGIPAIISGGGGAVPERFDGIGRHFLVIDADPSANSLSTRVVRVD